MASAVLRGVTKLDASGMQRGFQQLRASLQKFRRDVARPFAEAAGAMATFARRAALAATAVGAFGTHKAFRIEGMEEQFGMLLKNTAAGKQRVKELIDLAARTPFDLGPWVEAARTLQAVGGNQLGGDSFLTMLGDTAATMKVDVQQAAIWTAKLYNSLKSGSGVGVSGDDMMRAGIIRPETYAKLKELGRDVSGFAEAWQLVTADLSRFNGGMERLSRTGSGMLAVFRGLASVGIVQVFRGFADRVKDVVNQLNAVLMTLYRNGAFQRWGAAVGEWAQRVVNWVWRIVQAWRNLDDNTRAQLKSWLGIFTAVFVSWKAGFLTPLLTGCAGLLSFMVPVFGAIAAGVQKAVVLMLAAFKSAASGFSLLAQSFGAGRTTILKALLAIVSAIAGFKIGNIIFDSLSPSAAGGLELVMLSWWGVVEMFGVIFRNIWELAKTCGKNIWRALTGQETSWSVDMKNLARSYADAMDQIVDEYAAKSKMVYDQVAAAGDPGAIRRIKDALKENIGAPDFVGEWAALGRSAITSVEEFTRDVAGNIGSLFSGLLPESVRKFLDEFRKTEGLKFPEAPKLKPLDQQLNTKGTLRDLREISRYTLRGIYARFPRLSSPGAAVAAARRPESDRSYQSPESWARTVREANRPVVDNLSQSNTLLSQINTGIARIGRNNKTVWG